MVVQRDMFGNDVEIADKLERAKSDRQIAVDYLNATKGVGTAIVASISGGRSSAYMAVHYPADYYVFAVVLTEDPNCRIQDKGLLRAVQEKCPVFQGSRELDQTLLNVLRLEQLIGKEITWVWGKTYDRLIRNRSMIPNQAMRFCTEELKVYPIFNYTFSRVLSGEYDSEKEMFVCDPIEMQIGFRADEPHRVYKMLGARWGEDGCWDWSRLGSCENFQASLKCDIAGQFAGKHRWAEKYEWRFRQAPMFLEGTTKQVVNRYWEKKGWEFPEISNCDQCFFHTSAEKRRQHQLHPERTSWWIDQEVKIGNTFDKRGSLSEILFGDPIPLFDDEQESCACTD